MIRLSSISVVHIVLLVLGPYFCPVAAQVQYVCVASFFLYHLVLFRRDFGCKCPLDGRKSRNRGWWCTQLEMVLSVVLKIVLDIVPKINPERSSILARKTNLATK